PASAHGQCGVSSDSGDPRRGAPFRHRRPSGPPRQGARSFAAGGCGGSRPDPAQETSRSLWRFAGGTGLDRGRFMPHGRNKPYTGGRNLYRAALSLAPLSLSIPNLLSWFRMLCIPVIVGVFSTPQGWLSLQEQLLDEVLLLQAEPALRR